MITVIDAPFHLGLKRPDDDREPGTRFAPWTLRERGLVARLGARDGGAVEAPAYTGERQGAERVLHLDALRDYTTRLADAIDPVLERGEFPLVLGGDCSIALGAATALARRCRAGMLYLDGHRDLLTPDRTRHGALAGMTLAMLIGRVRETPRQADGSPLIEPGKIVPFGFRDSEEWYDYNLVELAQEHMQAVSLDDARAEGITLAIIRRLSELFVRGVEKVWIHLDTDILDDESFWAVDSRQAGGMTLEELRTAIDIALGTGRIAGMHVTIFDPERDIDRHCATALVDMLVKALDRVRR